MEAPLAISVYDKKYGLLSLGLLLHHFVHNFQGITPSMDFL